MAMRLSLAIVSARELELWGTYDMLAMERGHAMMNATKDRENIKTTAYALVLIRNRAILSSEAYVGLSLSFDFTFNPDCF